MKVIIISDSPKESQDKSFIGKYIDFECSYWYPDTPLRSVKEQNNAVKQILKETDKDDILVFWYDFMAVLCYWQLRFKCQKRKIIAINILLKDKNTLKNRLAKFLYRKALKSNEFIGTVTAKEYGQNICNMLNIKKELPLLHDVIYDSYRLKEACEVETGSVFMGGRNGRDWKKIIEIANILKDVKFNLVMPNDAYESYKSDFPSNCSVYHDIAGERFNRILRNSQIVCMPLDTDAPAGLIVFFYAISQEKVCISTSTPVTREYLPKEWLCSSTDEFVEAIKKNLVSSGNMSLVDEVRNNLEKSCSEEYYSKRLNQIIQHSGWIKK